MSRLTAPVRLDITLSFIVLDKRALDGLTLAQVADFSAVLGLSMIDYERVSNLRKQSILKLFSDGSAVDSATPFDLTYLKGLYAGEAGISFDRRAAQIAGRMQLPEASEASLGFQ